MPERLFGQGREYRTRSEIGYPLTDRERQVVAVYAELGLMSRVAERLAISVQTVKNHITAVHRKTGAATSIEMFYRLGWLRIPDEGDTT
jgi:two-component system response regulator DesR